jgi:hypothetical protein
LMLNKTLFFLSTSFKQFMSIGICLLYGSVFAAFEPLQLDVVVVREQKSLWSSLDIEDTLNRTNEILSQCAIYIVKAKDIESELMGIPLGYESGALSLKIYNEEKMPVLLLLNGVDYKNSAGLSPGPTAVFLSYYSRSEEYLKVRSHEYDTLAHELGHMLGDLRHIPAVEQKNLMAGYLNRQSGFLDSEQCKKMREHKELKPKKNHP